MHANVLCSAKCALVVGDLREQNDELISAVTANRIAGTNRSQQARGDPPEQLVTGRVPKRVIDGLEAVKVEVEQGELRSHPRRVCHCLVKTIQQQEAIGKAGERVEVGTPIRLGVRLLK